MGSGGGSFAKNGLLRLVPKVLGHQRLVEGIKWAVGVCCKCGQGVNQRFLVSMLPLEPPDMSIPLKGDLVLLNPVLRWADA